MTDGTNGFSGSKSSIITAIDVPLPGGYTYTDKCITQADTLFSTSARAGAAQIILVLTDGAPTDQAAAVVASQAAIANGIVIVGVGANVGSVAGRSNILALTSNPCPANTGGCSAGLTGAPQCVTPCNDHYVDASTFVVLDTKFICYLMVSYLWTTSFLAQVATTRGCIYAIVRGATV